MRVLEGLVLPDDGAVALPEGHERTPATEPEVGGVPSGQVDQRVPVREAVAGVAKLQAVCAELAVQVARPDGTPGPLVQRVDLAGAARGDEAVSDDLGHRV